MRAVVTFPPGADFFDGHFPGLPVLPGVVQLGVAARIAASRFQAASSPLEIRRLKFAAVVRPGIEVGFEIKKGPEGNFTFRFFDEKSGAVYSSGTLVYRAG